MQWVDRMEAGSKLRDRHILLYRGAPGAAWRKRQQPHSRSRNPRCRKRSRTWSTRSGFACSTRGRGGVEPTAYGRALVTRGQAIFDELKLGIENLPSLPIRPSASCAHRQHRERRSRAFARRAGTIFIRTARNSRQRRASRDEHRPLSGVARAHDRSSGRPHSNPVQRV